MGKILNEKLTHQLNVPLTESEHDGIRKRAESMGLTANALVRAVIHQLVVSQTLRMRAAPESRKHRKKVEVGE